MLHRDKTTLEGRYLYFSSSGATLRRALYFAILVNFIMRELWMDLRLQMSCLRLFPVGIEGAESNGETEFGSDSAGIRISAIE